MKTELSPSREERGAALSACPFLVLEGKQAYCSAAHTPIHSWSRCLEKRGECPWYRFVTEGVEGPAEPDPCPDPVP